MKRCVSKCSGLKEEDCTEPCSFIGKKYCRLSTRYKMGPYPGCAVTKKETTVKPKTRTVAKEPSTHGTTNAVLELVQAMPGLKEKAEQIKKSLAPLPSDTLFHELDEPVRKELDNLIKMGNKSGDDSDSGVVLHHSKEDIALYKKLLNRMTSVKPKTRAKTAKAKTVTRKETTVKPNTHTVAKGPSAHGNTNELFEMLQAIPGLKEKGKQLKKTLAPLHSDTLFYELDEPVRKDLDNLIKMGNKSGDDSDSGVVLHHSKEDISLYKRMLNRLTSVKPKTRAKPKPRAKTKTVTTKTQPLQMANMNAEIKKKEPSTKKTKNKLTHVWSRKNNPKEYHAETIQWFMKKTGSKRKALFLGHICSDSGVCIALGKEKRKLMDFFQFNTFEHAKGPYKTIGEPSGNGFVKELKYEREGYVAYAILKSSDRANADNLAYEYLVGTYLNEVSKRFPTFIETYGLYHYKTAVNRGTMQKRGTMANELIPFDPTDIKNVCAKSANLCVLSQHLKNAQTFYRHFQLEPFRNTHSAYVFYQIYFTLHQIRKEFTHYDLHMNNVLLYEPVDGKYIQYHYHSKDKTVSYKSRYLVKIIDYGRSFYQDAPAFFKKVNDEKSCQPPYKKGFSEFSLPNPGPLGRAAERTVGHANSLFKNESHDLRFMFFTSSYMKSKFPQWKASLDQDYLKILEDTIYMKELSPHSRPGTIEDLGHSDKIHNVTDACERWEAYVSDPERIRINEKEHETMTSLGDLHIYTDGRDLEFIQA